MPMCIQFDYLQSKGSFGALLAQKIAFCPGCERRVENNAALNVASGEASFKSFRSFRSVM